MNLHTAMIMKLKEKTDIKKQNAVILRKIDSVLKNIDDLREDPLFIDNIHGEQELNLDQTIELLTGIRANFVPTKKDKEYPIGFEASSFDVS